jgi:threonyl-tRNA synthetase
LELYPDTKTTIGPAIDDGFYYDLDFSSSINDKDLEAIEKKMKELLKKWAAFSHEEKTQSEAEEYFKGNEYKLELIKEIADKGEKITFYSCGGFTDLCRGGHSENPSKEISPDSFKLDRVAGAYWRGDEKKKMLTRIYGLAFNDKAELEKHLHNKEEALKRDHRELGKKLELFTFDEEIGKGLVHVLRRTTNLHRYPLTKFFCRELLREGVGNFNSICCGPYISRYSCRSVTSLMTNRSLCWFIANACNG